MQRTEIQKYITPIKYQEYVSIKKIHEFRGYPQINEIKTAKEFYSKIVNPSIIDIGASLEYLITQCRGVYSNAYELLEEREKEIYDLIDK